MLLVIGQRWQFSNDNGLKYIAEVMKLAPDLELQVIQKISPDKRPGFTPKPVGEVFTPNHLEIDSVNSVTKTHGISTDGVYCEYTYLPGQDSPQHQSLMIQNPDYVVIKRKDT